jgi:aryl-phospho-beta-D-glucosidase BglC (GH1 family)
MKRETNDPAEARSSAFDPTQCTRRSLLRSAAAIASAAVFPFGHAPVALRFSGQSASPAKPDPSKSTAPATNPRWYGFNLIEYFSTDPDWMKYFPYKNDGMFPEDDFRWIRDWGFNWVRLPMDYRFWTAPDLSP